MTNPALRGTQQWDGVELRAEAAWEQKWLTSGFAGWWLKAPPRCVPSPGGLGQAAQPLLVRFAHLSWEEQYRLHRA